MTEDTQSSFVEAGPEIVTKLSKLEQIKNDFNTTLNVIRSQANLLSKTKAILITDSKAMIRERQETLAKGEYFTGI